MADRTRPIRIEFCVTEQEKKLIQQKMAQLGTHNMGAYLRKVDPAKGGGRKFVRIMVENRMFYVPQATQTLRGISLLIRAQKSTCAP